MRQLLLAAAVLAALAACTTPSEMPGGGRDIRTASDETEADRRAHVRLELAAAYFSRGQLETALDEVKQALAARPDLPEAFNLRGLIYAGLGEPKVADESFRRALQLNPRDADAMHNYGWFLCQQQRYADAEAQFARALAHPTYRDVLRTQLAQGVCQARAGRLEEAERTLLRAYEMDTGNPFVAVNLSEVLMRRGDFERARFYIRRVNAQPDFSNAQTLWLAARIEHRLGNTAAAEDFGRQLRGRFPNAPETRSFERGRYDE